MEELLKTCGPTSCSHSCSSSGLRRSLSEGSLLLESRSTRFLSDSSIHRLTRPTTLDVDPAPHHASINTLRKQLTRKGGTLSHMLLLLNGTKVETSRS